VNTLPGRLSATGLIPLFRCDNFKYIKSFWIFQISGEKILEGKKGWIGLQ
jgi:hypothetical protein